MKPAPDRLLAVAAQFAPPGRLLALQPYGNGNVHDTYLVTREAAAEPHFILQRLNTRVFRRPEAVMRNLRLCTEHLGRRLPQQNFGPRHRWEVPRVLPARDGRDYFVDAAGASGAASALLTRPTALTPSATWSTPGKWATPWASFIIY